MTLLADGRERSEWRRTAFLAALHANLHRDPRKHKPYTTDDFFPFAAERTAAPPEAPHKLPFSDLLRRLRGG